MNRVFVPFLIALLLIQQFPCDCQGEGMLRPCTGGWTGHDAIPLMDAPLAPLCAPAIAARLLHPADLSQAALLRSYRSGEWPAWFEAAGVACPPLTGPVFDSSVALAELAAAGEGTALLPVSMFGGYVSQGRLVQPFGVTLPAGRYYLAWPSDRPAKSAMNTFSRWLSGVIAGELKTADG